MSWRDPRALPRTYYVSVCAAVATTTMSGSGTEKVDFVAAVVVGLSRLRALLWLK
jgi:hypothetical protein